MLKSDIEEYKFDEKLEYVMYLAKKSGFFQMDDINISIFYLKRIYGRLMSSKRKYNRLSQSEKHSL